MHTVLKDGHVIAWTKSITETRVGKENVRDDKRVFRAA